MAAKKLRWCLFDHPINAPLRDGKPQRGITATHLADVNADVVVPVCETKDAVVYLNVNEPSGFILACVRCLSYYEAVLP